MEIVNCPLGDIVGAVLVVGFSFALIAIILNLVIRDT